MIRITLQYLQSHPLTFNLYKRNKPYKPMNGLMYEYEGERYLLIRKWGNHYVTYQNQTYPINHACYHALASGKDVVKRVEIFDFKNGFEESTEGKLLIESLDRLLTEQEALECQDLFDYGLVSTFVTDYLLQRTLVEGKRKGRRKCK